MESIKNNRQKRHRRISDLFDSPCNLCSINVHRWQHLITTAMIYKITFKDSSGYYTVTKNFANTDDLGKYIQNEMANYGGKEIGVEEFESMQDMLEKRYKKYEDQD